MPAYTFIASAHAVANAGLTPHFLDVDDRSLGLTIEIVKRALDEQLTKPVAILVVSAYGAPLDIEAWDHFSDDLNIPVIFDGAAAITSITRIGKAPICVSLHATKTLGIGEGGAVLSSDTGLSDRITAMTGFGFTGTERVSQFRGGNYRISEYAAAIGLAALDALPARVLRLEAAAATYRFALGDKRTRMQENMGEGWISSTLNVRLPADAVEQTTERLDSREIGWRRWWGRGCHTHPAFESVRHEDLSTTAAVANEVIGLPFFEDITESQINRVVDCLV
jgi:dTDP-4-amino-4,6-dideoxygalactose transaminase